MSAETDFLAAKLADTYIVPPFSILDQRQGYWQDLRRSWLALGIQSELGRGADAGTRHHSTPEITPGGALAQGWTKRTDGQPSPEAAGDSYVGKIQRKGLLSSGAERLAIKVEAGGGMLPGMEEPITRRIGVMDGQYDASQGENAYGGLGTSVFDPLLCQLVYSWWCPRGGSILDPFAGGSVRGIVAAMLGHPYTGIDLSRAQCEANEAQAREILKRETPPGAPPRPMPRWIVGDSHLVLQGLPAKSFDLVFTCPPYYDLEVYSDDPLDLSNQPTYGAFAERYRQIVEFAAICLRPSRFMVLVVSEIRGSDGNYAGLVPTTINALITAGLSYYNEAIIVNSIGTLPLRVSRYFESGRKLGRSHQNLIAGIKGKPERGWDWRRDYSPPDPQLNLALPEPPAADFLEEEL